MDRRHFLSVAAVLATAACLPASGQAKRPLKLAWFSGGVLADQRAYVEAFLAGMKDLGYTEGRDFAVQYFWRGETIKPFTWIARDVAAAKPDVIMATCEITASAAKAATPAVPIVLTASTDPVANGIVPSLARPGGNVTGISLSLIDVSAKRLELLREFLPKAERVVMLSWKYEKLSPVEIRATEDTARKLGITLSTIEAEDDSDFERAFQDARRAKADAMLDMAGLAWTFPYFALLPKLELKHRIPVVHFVREVVEHGGLISYGPNVADGFRRSARYVDRIAKGARPAELPIEQPDRIETCVNLATARALGITMPQSILLRADRVIG